MQLPTITNKQKEILLLLYRFRFLNRIQIQKLLKHKNPKNTNVWLKDLTTKSYTKRIFEKRAGINEPAIYFISTNGIKFLKSMEGCEKEYLKKLYQESRRSNAFIGQCILIAETYLNLESQNLKGLKFYTQSDFPQNGIIRDLLPGFAYIQEINTKIEHYTCELLKEGLPRFAIRARIKKYLEFFPQNNTNKINIIFICPTDSIQKYVDKFARKFLEDENIEDINFYAKTILELVKI